jgi:hypothetical protein
MIDPKVFVLLMERLTPEQLARVIKSLNEDYADRTERKRQLEQD